MEAIARGYRIVSACTGGVEVVAMVVVVVVGWLVRKYGSALETCGEVDRFRSFNLLWTLASRFGVGEEAGAVERGAAAGRGG